MASIRFHYIKDDRFVNEMLGRITRELLEKAREVKELGELYARQSAKIEAEIAVIEARIAERDKRTAERDKKTAERNARTAERDARTAERNARTAERDAKAEENEIIAAQRAAKAAEYKELSIQHAKKTAENETKIVQLQKVLTVAENLRDLSATGTKLLQELTPLQIEFKKQVNQRAELINRIAAEIESCKALLDTSQYDALEEKITSLNRDFQKLEESVRAEDKAQEDVLVILEDQYQRDVVEKMGSLLETIRDQKDYYDTLKEKSYAVELRFLEETNSVFNANQPIKEGSDALSTQCKQAFSLIKQRLKQKKEAESPPSSRASTPPSVVESSPLSRSSSEAEAEDDIIGRSSPNSSNDRSDSDDELKERKERRLSLSTSQVRMRLQVESRLLPSRPQQSLQPSPVSSAFDEQRPEIPSVASLGLHKPKPSQALEARESVIKSNISIAAIH